MTYHLGVDLGTTYTAAAVWRDGKAEIATLGNRTPSIPSVLLLREDEELLTGEAATRRAATEPNRVAREFKRRLGDPTPIIVGGTPYSAASLMGRLLRWVVDKVAEVEGGPADTIAVSHPANWGQYKKDLLAQAIQVADLDDVRVLTEPEAAAIHYASLSRVETGSVVAVYDLGGGTFDAAVLRKTDTGFEIMGEPQGVERLGGVDFDEAVFQHVVRSTDGAIEGLDPEDPASLAAVARLRQECVDAKEALSEDTDVSIPVLLPNLQTEVRLTRAEFEHLIRPSLADSITSMGRALRSAGVEPGDVSTVLLVGGSSRIPLVAQLVSSEFGRPVSVDAHPKHAIPLGAAIVASGSTDAAPAATTTPAPAVDAPATPPAEVPPPVEPTAAEDEPASAPPEPPPTQPTAPVDPAPTQPDVPAAAATGGGPVPPPAPDLSSGGDDGGRKLPVPLLAGVGVVLVLIVVAFFVLGGGDDDPAEVSQEGETTTTTADDDGETTTTTESTTTTSTRPPGPFVELADVVVEDGRFRINYQVFDFDPLIGGDADSKHLHFFLDTTAPENAGTNGNPPGSWEITDDPSTFLLSYGPDAVGTATRMCGVVATVDHQVFDPASGTCVDLPV